MGKLPLALGLALVVISAAEALLLFHDLGEAATTTADASKLPPGTRVRLVLRPDAVLIARDESTAAEA